MKYILWYYQSLLIWCTCNTYTVISSIFAHVTHILWYHQLYSYGAHTLRTMISRTYFIWCTCIKYKLIMITWNFNHIIWQEHYYNGNIIRQVILKESKEFRKSPTSSFEKVLLKLCQGFEVVSPLPGLAISIKVELLPK
jgi:hypothetical protein